MLAATDRSVVGASIESTWLHKALVAAACVFVFAIPWAASLVLPGVGTCTRFVGIVLVGVWAASALVFDRVRKPHLSHLVTLGWVLWIGLSTFWTISTPNTLVRFSQAAQLFLFAYIVWNLRVDRAKLALLFQAFVAGCWVAFLELLVNVLTGNVTEFQRRATLTNANENEVGLILALGMSMAYWLASGHSSGLVRRLRLTNFAFCGAGFLGIMFTASRGFSVRSGGCVVYTVTPLRVPESETALPSRLMLR